MRLGLTNTIAARGTPVGGDGLALDLQFAADKTLTARKGPTPILTRGSTGTFVGSNGLIQTAAVNAARFDHDPVTLASRGLLIEEGRTNSLIRSGEFGATAWTKISTTETTITALDGTTTASSFNEGTANTGHDVRGAFGSNRPIMGAIACTLSVFLQAGTRRYVLIDASDFTNGVGMVVDTQTWSVTDAKSVGTGWTYTSNRLTNYGNGWYRAELTFTPPAATGVIPKFGGINASTITNLSPTYVGTSSTFIFWGAQLEAGSFATSYIPTTTSALARSADVCSITGANFTGMYNQPEGTLFADVTPQTVAQASAVLVVNTTTFFNSHTIYKGDVGFNLAGRRWGAQTFSTAIVSNIATSTDVATAKSRLAYAYKLNDFAFAASGSLVGTDTSGTMPSPTTMHIGNREGSLQINGHLAAVRYYKKRLDNDKLASITV